MIGVVHAAPLTLPFGWSEDAGAAPSARARASAWAKAWGGELEQVMSTAEDDDFAETLAVVEVGSPVPPAALESPEAATPWLRERLRLAMGRGAELVDDSVLVIRRAAPGIAVVRGRGRVDGRVVMLAVGPRGPHHVAVVLQVAAGEEVLYAGVFDGAVEELDDLRPPLQPFPRGSLRLLALLAWLAAGIVVGVLWTRRSLPRPGARVAGQQVALALMGAAVLVLLVARVVLGGSGPELALADGSPWGFALELAMGGPIMAVLVLGGCELWERRLTPVASAPQQGSFAISGAQRRRAAELAMRHPPSDAYAIPPAITGDTQVGPPPAITGDTQVGPPPAITGDTQVGRAPAISGNTKVGPPPKPPVEDDYEAPPVREIIAGAIEVSTHVGPRPLPPTEDTAPRARRLVPGVAGSTPQVPTASGREDGPASLIDPGDPMPALDGRRPAPTPTEPDAATPRTDDRASQSDLFPKVELGRGPSSADSHPALDLPLPPRRS
ncbi:MAG: hypothetical protein H6712_18035 [Myxococcales bacterium]|nr:hypothetical protein [Myxococcales bacterium]